MRCRQWLVLVLDRINLRGMHVAAIASMAIVTLVTILSELSAGFKGVLTLLAFNHWIAKSVIAIVVFVGITWLMNKNDRGFLDKFDAEKWGKITAIATVLFGVIIFLFFALKFFTVA